MPIRLVQRRTVWWPTLIGWCSLLVFLATPATLWCLYGEAFLSTSRTVPANVLIVEGWIGPEPVRAAAEEFKRGHYQYVVTTGGLTGRGWSERRWSYTEAAGVELMRCGVPANQIIPAPIPDVERQRTFEMASAAWRLLKARGIQPSAINVFSRGPHARRSRLVYAKVFGDSDKVGVLSWKPANETGLWWRSSERASEFIKETIAYFFEALLNSGRASSRPSEAASVTAHAEHAKGT